MDECDEGRQRGKRERKGKGERGKEGRKRGNEMLIIIIRSKSHFSPSTIE